MDVQNVIQWARNSLITGTNIVTRIPEEEEKATMNEWRNDDADGSETKRRSETDCTGNAGMETTAPRSVVRKIT